MNYLLDTCLISEFRKKQPGQKVIDWLDAQLEETLFLSTVTIGEFRKAFPGCLRQSGKPNWRPGLKTSFIVTTTVFYRSTQRLCANGDS